MSHPAVEVAHKLGGSKARDEVALAAHDPDAYVAQFAARLGQRNITKPTKILPWIALVDALTAKRLAVELDHRTFPEDVVDALDGLRSVRRSKSRWTWAKDVDEGTSTADFLAAAVHATKLPFMQIDLGSDSIVVVVAKPRNVARLRKLGCKLIKGAAISSPKLEPGPGERKLIAAEDKKPHAEFPTRIER